METGASDGFDLERHHDAFRAAAQRVHRDRRKMTLEDAQDIVRIEFARRGLSISARARNQFALMMHGGPLWPLLHPIQAHREGWRVSWPWSRDA